MLQILLECFLIILIKENYSLVLEIFKFNVYVSFLIILIFVIYTLISQVKRMNIIYYIFKI